MMYSNKGFISVEDFSLQPVADSPFKIGFFGHGPQLCYRPGLNLADSFLAYSHFCSKLTKCFWLISIKSKSCKHNLLLTRLEGVQKFREECFQKFDLIRRTCFMI